MEKIEDYVDFDGKKWTLVVSRNMNFWHNFLSRMGHFENMVDYGINVPTYVIYITFRGVDAHAFFVKDNFEDFSNAVVRFIKSKGNVKKLEKYYYSYAKNLLASFRKCDENLTEKNLKSFLSAYKKFCPSLLITTAIGRAGAEELKRELKNEGYSETKIPSIINSITYPDKRTPLLLSQKDLLEIGKFIQEGNLTINSKEVDARLRKWLDKWSYIPVNFNEDPWTFDDALSQLNGMLKKNCAGELNKMEKINEEKLADKKNVLKSINDKEIKILAEAVATGTYLNEYRKSIFSKVSLGYRGIFKKIAKMAGSENWRDCYYLTGDEMLGILGGKRFDLPRIIKDRQIVAIYTYRNGETKLIPESDLKIFVDYINNLIRQKNEGGKGGEKLEDAKEIKGFGASKGSIRGIVKILFGRKDFDKLLPGEILVTTMTSVDFVPVMERAGAFITNEGGITSHASIVAREMGKPCIIGTKIATKVLKDGDLVEVNADEGIVRILKRAS